MCSLYQSQEVSCFNVDNWNLLTRTALHDLHSPGKTTGSPKLYPPLFPPPQQQIWYTGSKQSCVNSAWINHPLLSISLHFTLCLFFLSVVHLCRSLRRGRCCKLCEKAPDLLPPCPEIEMNSLILEVDMPYSICKPWLFQPPSAHAVFIL